MPSLSSQVWLVFLFREQGYCRRACVEQLDGTQTEMPLLFFFRDAVGHSASSTAHCLLTATAIACAQAFSFPLAALFWVLLGSLSPFTTAASSATLLNNPPAKWCWRGATGATQTRWTTVPEHPVDGHRALSFQCLCLLSLTYRGRQMHAETCFALSRPSIFYFFCSWIWLL